MSEFYTPFSWERNEEIAERLVSMAEHQLCKMTAIMEPVRMYANPGERVDFVLMRFDRDSWRFKAERWRKLATEGPQPYNQLEPT